MRLPRIVAGQLLTRQAGSLLFPHRDDFLQLFKITVGGWGLFHGPTLGEPYVLTQVEIPKNQFSDAVTIGGFAK